MGLSVGVGEMKRDTEGWRGRGDFLNLDRGEWKKARASCMFSKGNGEGDGSEREPQSFYMHK